MAYDKVVDSAVLNAGLTQIANAIREKGGTGDVLSFPDGMAEAIVALSGVGGDGVAQGSITFDANTKDGITIQHGLGAIPNFYYFYSADAVLDSTATYIRGIVLVCGDVADVTTYIGANMYMSRTTATEWSVGTNTKGNGGYVVSGSGSGTGCLVYSANTGSAKFQFLPPDAGTYLYAQAGKTYKWVMAVI